ncbi:expansin B2 [Striga asiatica]|uniref:Expansin B2 n=1 Tax=Striga asiatica TaxID=4170 RepID=A0A5A7QIY7_STRAF|nr:expansin B2 [Striga asiatica]
MAIPGKEDQLRSKGIVDIQYKKVDCNYKGANVAFRVDKTSNQYYFAMAVQYFNGDGLTGVELRRANTNDAWLAMKISWGGVYRVNLPAGYGPPFSVRLTQSSKTVVAENVIPANYDITIYKSNVNF